MPTSRRIVIVGGGLAAQRAVEALHQMGSADEVVLVGAESCPPYDRPPLTKHFLRGSSEAPWLSAAFPPPGTRHMQGCRAAHLDTAARKLSIDDSPALKYDELVIATGANPRRIEGIDGAGVHVVRTMEDSMALRAAMTEHRRVVIVGGGFIGTEVAATARSMGIEVTLVETMDAPLARVVGTGPADEIARLHLEAGVDLRCSTSVLESLGQGDERVVRLSDGSEIDAPVLLLAVGASPSVDWLTGSGVEVDDGVVCDGQGRTSVPHVWAMGDVASWWQSLAGAPVRLEHWTSAAEQGVAVAHALMGRQVDVDLVPYFWSDQYGKKIQMVGLPAAADDVTIDWVGPEMGGMLAMYGRGGRATGVLGIHAMRQVTRLRPLLARAASYDELLAAADEG